MAGSDSGVGALLGSWLMVAVGTVSRAGSLMLVGTLLWQFLLLIFALTPNYYAALGVLVFLGIIQTVSLTSITILLLGTVQTEMRGRMMGLRSLAVAPLFVGTLLSSVVAESHGASLATMACAAVGILVVVVLAPWVPREI